MIPPEISKAARQERIRRGLLPRPGLLDFVKVTHPGYKAGWFHEQLCAELEEFSRAVAAGESPRLMLFAPPRHGKSEVVSRRLPVFHLGHNPDHEIVLASYGQELADDHSRAAREIARGDEAYSRFPSIRPKRKESTWYADYHKSNIDRVNNWAVGDGGCCKSVGVGGPLTGRGAHMLVIDDPVKDAAEALSETTRDGVWNWFLTTAYTRLAPGGGILVMMTRWHEDDLAGRLLNEMEQGGEHWRIISFSAIAEEDEPHRKAGEALHPERYPLADLLVKKATLGPYIWEALYQQRPRSQSGGLFQAEYFQQLYTDDPEELGRRLPEVIISADLTFKGTAGTDFVSLQVWGRDGPRKYLLDRVHGRMSYVQAKAAFKALCIRWPRAGLKLVEDKANGPALISDLQSEIPGLVAFEPGARSKFERASVGSLPAFAAGDVWLPAHARWLADYIGEHLAFPRGSHDDDVDATSQVMLWWLENSCVFAATQANPWTRDDDDYGA